MVDKEALKKFKETEQQAKFYNKEKGYKQNLRYISQQERFKRYDNSKSGRVSSAFVKGLSAIRNPTRALYSKSIPLKPYYSNRSRRTIQGESTGGRGRPKGTVDVRYQNYGGVYGFRKAMAMERFKQRQQILENSVTNPRQRAILNQINQRDQLAQQSPEARIIPDTKGDIPLMKKLMFEINEASNIFE